MKTIDHTAGGNRVGLLPIPAPMRAPSNIGVVVGLSIATGTLAAVAQTSGDDVVRDVQDRLGIPEDLRETSEAEDLVEEAMDLRERRALMQPEWSLLLPRLSLQATVDGPVTSGKRERETRAMLLAEVPIGARATRPSAEPTEVAPPANATRAGPASGSMDVSMDVPVCLATLRAAAVEHAHADSAGARSMVTRARRAAWLPEIRLRVERRFGRNESLDLEVSGISGPLGLDTVNDARYEARATWDLANLIFSAP